MTGNKCICRGNWRKIVAESEHMIGRQFRDRNGYAYTFFGLVYSDDDYYYGMSREGDCCLLSCVVSFEGHGYRLITKKRKRE